MQRGWGYGKNSASIETQLQRSKRLINETEVGVKVYEMLVGYKDSVTANIVFWHDGRDSQLGKSYVIIKDSYWGTKGYDISDLKTQKTIFKFIADKITGKRM